MPSESWMWLAAGLGWGAVNTGELLNAYPGGAEEILHALGSPKLDEVLTQKQAERLAQSRPADYALRIAHAATQGVATLGFDDEDYPATLRGIHNPPPVLFVKGDARLLNGRLSIGMVGARRPSAYGVEAMKAIGRGVALGGAVIISGLAAGLDSEAHKAALAVNGPTIACIAFGHDHCYPAANKKLMEVIERSGAVVSEYPLGTGAEKAYFLHRNRIIAGLSHGLVVVEARRYSGTMSTVNFAIDYGRDVFGVPGSIFSDLSGGTNAMVREGAYLAASASDVLAVYGIQLEVEDPVAAAAKQAAEGRPQAAPAAPPWQQGLKRYAERTHEENARAASEELPGQQSLGKLLREQLGAGAGEPVSAAQAVEAFRQLQRQMPPAANSEADARNHMLDEMVAAVNDSVQISRRPAQGGGTLPAAAKRAGGADNPPAAKGDKQPKPFPWHQVERVNKKELEQSQSQSQNHNQSLGARLFGLNSPPGGAPPPSRGRAVGRVEAVQGLSTVAPVTPLPPPQAVSPNEMEAAPRANTEKPPANAAPVPAAQRPAAAPPRADASLAGRLNSLRGASGPQSSAVRRGTEAQGTPRQTQAAGVQAGLQVSAKPALPREAAVPPPRLAASAPSAPSAPAAPAAPPTPEDPKDLLSESAQKALAQLGPAPLGLADICQRSGLTSAQAMAALTELELAGLSRQLAGRQFVIYQ